MEQKIILKKSCDCGNLMGRYQRDIEYELKNKKKDITTRQEEIDIENQILVKYGWNKLCCRNTYIHNKELPFIRNSNENAYIDLRHDPPITKMCLEIKPARTPPDFPLLPNQKKKEVKPVETIEEAILPKNTITKTTKIMSLLPKPKK